MRELYAVELRAEEARNGRANVLIGEWLDKHRSDQSAKILVEETDDDGRHVRLEQTDPRTGTLWRTDIAVGADGAAAHVVVRIRIRLAAGTIAPVEYEFRSPAIVRTLIRELDVRDGPLDVAADAGPEVGPSDIGRLVGELEAQDRHMPMVLVSRDDSGATRLEARDLTRQLAGLAHVRTLSSSQTAWELTHELGQPLSVFGGAVRVYFPGFSRDDDPYRHRVTFPDRVDERTVRHLRSWIGTLAAAAIPEHRVFAALRAQRLDAAKSAVQDANQSELQEFLDVYVEENEELRGDNEQLRGQVSELEAQLSRERSKSDALQAHFSDYQSGRSADDDESEHRECQSVREAIARIKELASTTFYKQRVAVPQEVLNDALAFEGYEKPEELLRATHAVMEAGAAYHDDVLGEPPGVFFGRRGFGYRAKPDPHLKVDEYKHPDQCLRIHWEVDVETRTWTITHIGRHQ